MAGMLVVLGGLLTCRSTTGAPPAFWSLPTAEDRAEQIRNAANLTNHAKFYVLTPPPELQRLRGLDITCEYFGHMYSFEMMYTEFFAMNPRFLAETAEEADFVVVPHCITYVYHMLRYGTGFNTVALTWEALRISQEEYLLPIVRWAQSTRAHQRTGGRNFVLVLALDKGRADYPLVSRATREWHAVTTVGNGSTWMKLSDPWLVKDPSLYSSLDVCDGATSTSKRRLVFYDQDIVVPVPTAFHWGSASESTHARDLLVFYAGSPNSCIRRHIVNTLAGLPDPQVFIAAQPLPRHEFSGLLYRARFCLVPDGFSSISARLYEVLVHGCVPVIIGEAFHPPFESLLDWRYIALFVRRTEIPNVPSILRTVREERYRRLHREIVNAHQFFGPDNTPFWLATNLQLQLRRRPIETAAPSHNVSATMQWAF